MSCCVGMCCRESSWLGVRRMLRNESLITIPDDDLTRSKHVGVILSVLKVFYVNYKCSCWLIIEMILQKFTVQQ